MLRTEGSVGSSEKEGICVRNRRQIRRMDSDIFDILYLESKLELFGIYGAPLYTTIPE